MYCLTWPEHLTLLALHRHKLGRETAYRNICDSKLAWDVKDQDPFLKRRKDWSSMLTETLKVPRTVAAYREPISQFTLHAFGDDSTKGSCGAVYAVVQQAQGTTQQLISAKSRLAKENQSIPRLELIAGHMALNLATNMQAALQLIPSTVHCWLDSAVAFC